MTDVILTKQQFATLAGGMYIALERPDGSRWRLVHEDYVGGFDEDADWHIGVTAQEIGDMAGFGFVSGGVTFLADSR